MPQGWHIFDRYVLDVAHAALRPFGMHELQSVLQVCSRHGVGPAPSQERSRLKGATERLSQNSVLAKLLFKTTPPSRLLVSALQRHCIFATAVCRGRPASSSGARPLLKTKSLLGFEMKLATKVASDFSPFASWAAALDTDRPFSTIRNGLGHPRVCV